MQHKFNFDLIVRLVAKHILFKVTETPQHKRLVHWIEHLHSVQTAEPIILQCLGIVARLGIAERRWMCWLDGGGWSWWCPTGFMSVWRGAGQGGVAYEASWPSRSSTCSLDCPDSSVTQNHMRGNVSKYKTLNCVHNLYMIVL